MTLIDKLKEVSAFLESKGIEDAVKEAEMLITEALHITKPELYSGDLKISDETSRHIDSLASRRAEGEPIQYIIGHVDFHGLKINVGRGVLIPRPETELLVEEVIKQLKRFTVHGSRFTVLDLCTGSGCIALALAKHLPQSIVYGVDRSEAAMVYATQNAIGNSIKNVHFKIGDLFEPVRNMKFDCIVSNPPYIKRSEIKTLQREVRDYEPLEALDGGKDGLYFYRKILRYSPEYLKEEGVIILEIGYDQSDDIKRIAEDNGFKGIGFIKDYAGIKRIFVGRI
ncbi:MAG: peptide chain release factor N(5)-glutamine methyltransferase [Nitrospirae bacterium]|nr:peptide chain release factor N(5)-glutamine methyltransferase [Nitrospirota bacterium]